MTPNLHLVMIIQKVVLPIHYKEDKLKWLSGNEIMFENAKKRFFLLVFF